MQRSLLEGKKSPEGKMDIVVSPMVSGIAAHESCGHPTEADRVLGREASQAGKSFIGPDGLGMKVGSEVVNVCDDPTLPHAIAYYETDDEGVRARRRYLYKEGRVHEFLQNRETASAFSTRSNGASRAVNYNVEAIVRMANTFVEPKDHSVEELLEGVKFGVYMKSFMEWNIDDKRYNFQFGCEIGWEIKRGKRVRMLKNPSYSGISTEFWNACEAIAGREHWTLWGVPNCGKGQPEQVAHTGHGAAPARFRNVQVGVMK